MHEETNQKVNTAVANNHKHYNTSNNFSKGIKPENAKNHEMELNDRKPS